MTHEAQQLSATQLKTEDQMLKIEGMLCQKSRLRERLAKIKKESKEKEENFLQEISRFNSDFRLRVCQRQTHTELLDLEGEMELMSRGNRHVSSMQEEERALQLDLQGLDNIQKAYPAVFEGSHFVFDLSLLTADLDRHFIGAEALTESVRVESLFVSQKPVTDSTCLRLRKELDMHKEGELELLREALSSEIHFLKRWTAAREVSGIRFNTMTERFHCFTDRLFC
ncbi:LOW QUALITY PROTEIN: coiled-coil domain-containing protein 172-like [Acanthopagrus schlegelii]